MNIDGHLVSVPNILLTLGMMLLTNYHLALVFVVQLVALRIITNSWLDENYIAIVVYWIINAAQCYCNWLHFVNLPVVGLMPWLVD